MNTIFPPEKFQEAINGIDKMIETLKKYNISEIRLEKAFYNHDDTCAFDFDETINISTSTNSIFNGVEKIARDIFIARLESQKKNLTAYMQLSKQ